VHDLSRLMSWWTSTLCLAILSPLRNLFSLKERRRGHVSLSYLWQSVQMGFMCIWGHNRSFLVVTHVLCEMIFNNLRYSGV
jgi:hypothetical protein